MNASAPEARKWVALAVMVATMLVATLTFGEDRSPCYEAYGISGLWQQMSFEEFSRLHCDSPSLSEVGQQEMQAYAGGGETSRTFED